MSKPMIPDDPRHGTANGYVNLKCRCAFCRAAWVVFCRGARARRALKVTPDDPRHGTVWFYMNHSCRCDACKQANSIYAHALYLQRSS